MIKHKDSSAILNSTHIITTEKNSYFTVEIRKRSPHDFIMVARDPFHHLNCEIPLKFENIEDDISLICKFPEICEEEFVDFINCDDYLFGMILITFHMQILKNLFMFCRTHKVQNLIIKASKEHFAGLGVYEEFIKDIYKVPTMRGIGVEITIHVHSDRLTECDEIIDGIMAKFRKKLWKDQKTNADIRNYLKNNVRLSIVA
jgi:hypothetical protein